MPLIDVGRPAADFTLPDQNAGQHALRDYAGRPLVLYFYPRDDTSGCTKEACGFRDLFADFEGFDATVLGISPDSVESHAEFATKHDLPFTLLADEPGEGGTPQVCEMYGVWREKTMYGRKYMGVVRTTYLVDPSGQIAKRWDNVKVSGHVEAVLDAVRSLASGSTE